MTVNFICNRYVSDLSTVPGFPDLPEAIRYAFASRPKVGRGMSAEKTFQAGVLGFYDTTTQVEYDEIQRVKLERAQRYFERRDAESKVVTLPDWFLNI